MPNTISLSCNTIALFCPTNPHTIKNYLHLLTSKFLILFSFFCRPTCISIFCLPTDETSAKSIKNNSPTDSEKQTAVAFKDKGPFFHKAFALSNTNYFRQDTARCSIGHFARDGACLVSVKSTT